MPIGSLARPIDFPISDISEYKGEHMPGTVVNAEKISRIIARAHGVSEVIDNIPQSKLRKARQGFAAAMANDERPMVLFRGVLLITDRRIYSRYAPCMDLSAVETVVVKDHRTGIDAYGELLVNGVKVVAAQARLDFLQQLLRALISAARESAGAPAEYSGTEVAADLAAMLVATSICQKRTKRDILDELDRSGFKLDEPTRMIDQMTRIHAGRWKLNLATLAGGLLMAALGLVVTLLSEAATEWFGGKTFHIFIGLIAGGAIMTMIALARLVLGLSMNPQTLLQLYYDR